LSLSGVDFIWSGFLVKSFFCFFSAFFLGGLTGVFVSQLPFCHVVIRQHLCCKKATPAGVAWICLLGVVVVPARIAYGGISSLAAGLFRVRNKNAGDGGRRLRGLHL